MREYGRILTTFFLELDVQRFSIPGDAAYLLVYFIAGPQSNALGCYKCPPGQVAIDLDWPLADAERAMKVLHRKKKVLYDKKTGWIWVRRFLDYNDPTAGNGAKACITFFKQIPKEFRYRTEVFDSLVRNVRLDAFKDDKYRDDIKNQLDTILNAIGNTIQKPSGSGIGLGIDKEKNPIARARAREGDPPRSAPDGGASVAPEKEADPYALTADQRKRLIAALGGEYQEAIDGLGWNGGQSLIYNNPQAQALIKAKGAEIRALLGAM